MKPKRPRHIHARGPLGNLLFNLTLRSSPDLNDPATSWQSRQIFSISNEKRFGSAAHRRPDPGSLGCFVSTPASCGPR
jgi:hypothetical protein